MKQKEYGKSEVERGKRKSRNWAESNRKENGQKEQDNGNRWRKHGGGSELWAGNNNGRTVRKVSGSSRGAADKKVAMMRKSKKVDGEDSRMIKLKMRR